MALARISGPGLSQAELAKLCNWTGAMQSYFESGTHKPSDEQLETLAVHLGLTSRALKRRILGWEVARVVDRNGHPKTVEG